MRLVGVGVSGADGSPFSVRRVAYVWALGWAVIASSFSMPLRFPQWLSVALAGAGAITIGWFSGFFYLQGRARRERVAGAVSLSVAWLAVIAAGLSLRSSLVEIYDYSGLLAFAALCAGSLGLFTALLVFSWWPVPGWSWRFAFPLLTAAIWALVGAAGVQIAILGWYLLGQVVLKPMVGSAVGFVVSGLAGGAIGGGFAGYLGNLILAVPFESGFAGSR